MGALRAPAAAAAPHRLPYRRILSAMPLATQPLRPMDLAVRAVPPSGGLLRRRGPGVPIPAATLTPRPAVAAGAGAQGGVQYGEPPIGAGVPVNASGQQQQSQQQSSINFKKSVWTFIDVVAILGSVGGALAALLNFATASYVLCLPLVLPVVSLVAALQREGLTAEVRGGDSDASQPGSVGSPMGSPVATLQSIRTSVHMPVLAPDGWLDGAPEPASPSHGLVRVSRACVHPGRVAGAPTGHASHLHRCCVPGRSLARLAPPAVTNGGAWPFCALPCCGVQATPIDTHWQPSSVPVYRLL